MSEPKKIYGYMSPEKHVFLLEEPRHVTVVARCLNCRISWNEEAITYSSEKMEMTKMYDYCSECKGEPKEWWKPQRDSE